MAQFGDRKKQHSKDIHIYVDMMQKLAEMAWPLLDPLAREERVADQFSNRPGQPRAACTSVNLRCLTNRGSDADHQLTGGC